MRRPRRSAGHEKSAPGRRGAFFHFETVAFRAWARAGLSGLSGGFGLLRRVPTLAFLTRQRDRRSHTASNEFHEPGDDPFIRVDAGAAEHFATIARTRPAGDLLGAISIL